MTPDPLFSILITAYNRAEHIARCVNSALAQTGADFEIVVVDDASTDDTPAVLAGLAQPRLRVIRHELNRGISAARASTVEQARGEWLVLIDSDWELLPGSLARLRELIGTLPSGVRMIRSRLRLDDGTISPSILPDGVTDYHGRLRWLEAVALDGGPSDAMHCVHRDVYRSGSYFHARRGIFESVWETNLARHEPSLWVADVLGLEHTDAANGTTREWDPRRMIPRLRQEGADISWQVALMLSEHGAELERHAPRYRRDLLRRLALESLMAGDRRAGVRHTRAALACSAGDRELWTTLALGLLGARPLAAAKVASRWWKTQQPPVASHRTH